MPGMSQNIKIRKGRVNGPVVTITNFQTPAVSGNSLGQFEATAIDTEDGDISANVVWSTAADGQLGTGASTGLTFTTVVGSPPEAQVLTASVTDSNGNTGTDAVLVTVNPV